MLLLGIATVAKIVLKWFAMFYSRVYL